ncbi:MAG TPA: hypothetical protein VGC41_12330, partial [Kofleriaceae bacterium]
LVPDTTVWILPTDDVAILALLNSSWYRAYAQQHFPPALNGAVRPKREYMIQLPIPELPRDQIAELLERCDYAEIDAIIRRAAT